MLAKVSGYFCHYQNLVKSVMEKLHISLFQVLELERKRGKSPRAAEQLSEQAPEKWHNGIFQYHGQVGRGWSSTCCYLCCHRAAFSAQLVCAAWHHFRGRGCQPIWVWFGLFLPHHVGTAPLCLLLLVSALKDFFFSWDKLDVLVPFGVLSYFLYFFFSFYLGCVLYLVMLESWELAYRYFPYN